MYNELSKRYSSYIDAFDALYKLNTSNEDEINKIYQKIKTQLIEGENLSPSLICNKIENAARLNNRYIKSYLKLNQKVSEEYHLDNRFLRQFTLEYTRILRIQDITVIRLLINDDLKSFIPYSLNKDCILCQNVFCFMFPFLMMNVLELCCYYGAVNCFKFLRSEFNFGITRLCLQYSFLGGNQEIINECLKYQIPDDESMKYTIASHNLDFVTFLMYEHNLKIDLEECANSNNLNAFFVYFDQTNDVNECFVHSPLFGIPSLCEFFRMQVSDIDAKSISLGYSALHLTANYNCIEESKLLISFDININAKNNDGETPLIVASKSNHEKMVDLLVLYGADINEKDNTGKTALHYAARNNNDESIDILLLHDADLNAVDNSGKKPALRWHKKLVHGFHEISKYFDKKLRH